MSKMRAVLFLSLAIFSIVSTGYAEDRFAAAVSGEVSSFVMSEKGAQFRVNITTPEGMHQFVFRNVSPSNSEALFFQGKRLNRQSGGSGVRGASADVIGRRLRVIFYGKRRSRLYTLTADVRPLSYGAPTLKGRIRHFSRWRMGLKCGNSAADVGFAKSAESKSARKISTNSQPVYDPPRLINVSTDADYEYFLIHGADTNAEIMAVINSVEAIYASQLGIRFNVLNQNVFSTPSQPYSSNNAAGLLLEFSLYTNSHVVAPEADLFHLYTGKNLDSGIIGAAFLGSICKTNTSGQTLSFGLTRNVSTSIKALVTAHEFGHKLNARHPEEVLNSPPPPSLMTGLVEPGNSSFSDFSIGEITSYIDQSGQCLQTALPVLRLRTSSRAARRPLRLRLRTVIRRTDTIGANCKVTLMASAKRRRLKANYLKPREVIELAGDEQVYTLVANMPARLRRSRPVFFRAAIACDDLENFSAIRRVNFLAGGKSAPGTKSWITELKNRLGN